MEGQPNRQRSPSAGQVQRRVINHSSSSPHYVDQITRLGLDPSTNSSTFGTGPFNVGVPTTTAAEQYSFSGSYMNTADPVQRYAQHTLPSNDFADRDFVQAYKQRNSISNGQQRPSELNLQQSSHQFADEYLNTDVDAPAEFADAFQQQDVSGKPDLLMLDPSLQGGNQQQNQSINPADLMGSMSTPQNQLITPSNMMTLDSRSPPGQSPSSQKRRMYSPNHSRNISLDPASAAFSQGQQPTDWSGMLGASFQQHRRAPSEHSDVSSSVAPSPFLPQADSFDGYDQNHSPMLGAQHDHSLYSDAFGIERFSLSDAQQQQQQQQQQRQGISPGHSPYVSPQMSPHQGLGISQDNPFTLSQNDMSNSFNGGAGPQMYNGQVEQDYASFPMENKISDMGQAAQMAPPEINVELAPPSRTQMFEPHRMDNDLDALSPPERGTVNLSTFY